MKPLMYFIIGFMSCWLIIATIFLIIEERNNGSVHLDSKDWLLLVLILPAFPIGFVIVYAIELYKIVKRFIKNDGMDLLDDLLR